MKKIGIIVAVEIKAVLDKYGSQLVEKEVAGYRILEYEAEKYQMIIVNCGAGEIAAASGTQFLISEYKVDLVINFGVVGGLTEAMPRTRTCIVERVVHYEFDTSEADDIEVGRYLQYPDIYIPADATLLKKALQINPELTPVTCASADRFVADPEKKREIHRNFSADICDMEAAGILLTCNRNQVPCMLIKCVSDSVSGGVEEFRKTINEAAGMCMEIVNQIASEL